MEKTEACAILRIPIEASRSEVEAAFRKRMREVRTRFDAARGMSLRAQYQREFAAIREAQDSLLGQFIEIMLEQPTTGEPLVDEAKVEHAQVDRAHVNPPGDGGLRVSEVQVDEEKVVDSQPHEPRADEVSVDGPEVDEPRAHEPQIHKSRVDEVQVNDQSTEEPRVNEIEVVAPQVDEPRAESPRVDELPTEAPAALDQTVPLVGQEPTGQSPQPIASTPAPLKPGQLFLSRFELQRELEIGSTGAVWLAQDHVSESQVALIYLPGFILSDRAGIDSLRNEIRRRAKLNHSNILHVFDLLEDKGRIAIEIESPGGRSLSELRFGKPNHVFEVGDLQAWVKQLCEALQYAHEEVGLIHGNIQPGNLTVDRAGSLKVKDFGISNCVSESISSLAGTPKTSEALQYKSPQQAAGETASAADDLYSLGATLYELLTSRPPFSAREIALQQNLKEPPTMTERRAELGIQGATIPLSWEETVAACLATDPSRRPQSAADVASRLQNTLPLSVIPAAAPAPSPSPSPSPPPPPAVPPRLPSQPPPPSLKPEPTATPNVPTSISTPSTRKPGAAIAGIFLLLVIGSAIAFIFHFLAEPKQGKLFVKTSPPEATVLIDGVDRGTTPLVLENVALGDHRLTIALNGYRREELIVPIKRSGPDSSLQIDLVQIESASPSSTITASQSESAAQQSSPTQLAPTPKISITPSVGGNEMPFVGVDVTPSAGESEATSPRVTGTPSSELNKTTSPQEGVSPSGSLSAAATPLSRQEIDVTKEEVIKRINALPGLSIPAKDRLIEKMDRARSMERLSVVPFDFGQTVLRRGVADKLVQTFDSSAMRDTLSDPTIVLVVAGYADAGGPADLNLRISQQRAEYVTKILKERANLLNATQTVGMGGSELLDSSRPDQNRAVEVWAVVPY